MRQTSFHDFHCSLARALEVVGDWWSPLIIRDLFVGVSRFDDLVADLGISRNLLSDRLKRLVAADVVSASQYSEHALRMEYSLTASGREFACVLMAMTAWGDRWHAPAAGPPIRFRHRQHRCDPIVSCKMCGEEIDGADVTFQPGPGGKKAIGTAVIADLIRK
jgi:DNA-binding HxlR family transcriptional regulator